MQMGLNYGVMLIEMDDIRSNIYSPRLVVLGA